MNYNGFELLEYTSPDRRGPAFQAARDAGSVERSYRLRVVNEGVDPGSLIAAQAALLGFSSLEEDDVLVDSVPAIRRYVARYLPHGLLPIGLTPPAGNGYSGTQSQNDTDRPYLHAHAIEECVPISGHVRAPAGGGFGADLPVRTDHGYALRVCYKNFPYHFRDDDQVEATDSVFNPLSADFVDDEANPVLNPDTTPADALPDEGDMLRLGWLSRSRYVVKRVKDRTRQVTLPNGIAYFDKRPGIDDRGRGTSTGLPFMQPRQDVAYTWVQVPVDAIPVNAIDFNRQCTNGIAFDGYRVGTLLFNGVDYEGPYQAGHGNRWYVDITYRTEYLPNYDRVSGEFRGWNSFPESIDGQFRYSYYSASRNGVAASELYRVFPRTGNFSALFRPDQVAPFATAAGYPIDLY